LLVPIGKARIARPGKDVTIVSFGIGHGIRAARRPRNWRRSVSDAEVIDLRTIRPAGHRDHRSASVQKTNRCVTVEEGWPRSGIGAEIAAQIMEQAFD
jgi:pyruvate dehydrogenase E1 component beta subunit